MPKYFAVHSCLTPSWGLVSLISAVSSWAKNSKVSGATTLSYSVAPPRAFGHGGPFPILCLPTPRPGSVADKTILWCTSGSKKKLSLEQVLLSWELVEMTFLLKLS